MFALLQRVCHGISQVPDWDYAFARQGLLSLRVTVDQAHSIPRVAFAALAAIVTGAACDAI
jgi:hypothetical protein